jgi:hypothetical protein
MTIRTPATLPNSADSDPRVLGWMTGFPPPQDKAVIFADGTFHKFPQRRWRVRAPCAATAQSIDAGELGPPRRAFLGTVRGLSPRRAQRRGADALQTGACGFIPDYIPPPSDR